MSVQPHGARRRRARAALALCTGAILGSAGAALAQTAPGGEARPAAPATTVGYPAGFDEPMPLYFETGALGPFHRPITTDVPEAQRYFDQGIQLLYAFAPDLAARSFREAWKRDPNCAMCYLGEAWAWGPYLNGPMTAADAPRAHAAIRRAMELRADHANEVERALIEAMATRYEPVHDPERRRTLDERWAEAANQLFDRYPHDLDIGFLAGEALMLLQPRREWWEVTNPQIQRIHNVLERVLAVDLTHPGACHLYIHATERTVVPWKAEPCAEHLGSSIPGASHIQHMPSHTYNRVGRWAEAVRANIDAWHSDLKAERGEGFAIYPSHNLHMLLFAASYDGQGAIAMQAARDYAALMDGGQFYQALTYMRFGRFDELVALDEPPQGPVFLGLWRAAKGYAELRTGDAAAARSSLERTREILTAAPENASFRGHPAQRLVGVVAGILEGELLRAEGDTAAAIEALAHAVALEDALRYDEPEPLPFSARHWLGNALLEAGRPQEAADVFRAELADHPHNGWSLFGLARALHAAGDAGGAAAAEEAFRSAWARSDTDLTRPVF